MVSLLVWSALSSSGAVRGWPSLDQTVVYEANLRAEGLTSGFAALTKRLASIRALGVNVLWLMPVQPVGKLRSAGRLGSPYATADYDAVNPEFGTSAEFKALIAAAHGLKMAVILDWVANHTAWDNPWVASHPDWYTRDSAGKIAIPAGTNWQDVADLDYGKPALRKAMIGSMKGWVDRFGIDGFRCDTADFVPFDFWKEAVPQIRAATRRPLLMLAEGFRSDHYAAGFDLTYGWPFYDKLCAIYKGGKASELASASAKEAEGLPAGARRLRFVTNHDKAAWEGTPLEFFRDMRGVRAATAVTALYGGTPLIYSGQEVGWAKRIPIFDQSAVDWDRDGGMRAWLASLFAFRKEHVAARQGSLSDFSTDDVIAFYRKSGDDEVLVVANPRNEARVVSVPSGLTGVWRDGILGGRVKIPMGLSVPPFGCFILGR